MHLPFPPIFHFSPYRLYFFHVLLVLFALAVISTLQLPSSLNSVSPMKLEGFLHGFQVPHETRHTSVQRPKYFPRSGGSLPVRKIGIICEAVGIWWLQGLNAFYHILECIPIHFLLFCRCVLPVGSMYLPFRYISKKFPALQLRFDLILGSRYYTTL